MRWQSPHISKKSAASAAGVAVTNVGGEELDEAQARALVAGADAGWQRLDAEAYQRRRRGNLVGQQYRRFRHLGTLLYPIPYLCRIKDLIRHKQSKRGQGVR